MRIFSHQRGPTPHQEYAQRVRATLGLTQQQLADLVGVSRVVLAQSEGRSGRSLPTKALLRLLDLDFLLPPLPEPAPVSEVPSVPLPAEADLAAPPTPVPVPELSDKERADLRFRLLEIRVARHPLQARLARVRIRLAQAQLRLALRPALHAWMPAADELGTAQLALLLNLAEATLRTEASQPALLTLRLTVLAFEAAEIQKLLLSTGTPARLWFDQEAGTVRPGSTREKGAAGAGALVHWARHGVAREAPDQHDGEESRQAAARHEQDVGPGPGVRFEHPAQPEKE